MPWSSASRDAPAVLRLPLEVVSVAPLLARAIQHLHEDRSLADLVAHG